jgi:KUP system potassium uptake protein
MTIALTFLFRKSDNLAAAYGIAVSLTMLMTSFLLFMALREIWRWTLWRSLAMAGLFVFIDAGFLAANSMKIAEGGYVPLVRCLHLWRDADLASRLGGHCAPN